MCGQENPEIVVKEWLKRAEEDIKSAKVMLETNHYTWSAFICQQALEKCLKAGYVKKRNEIPPYIHKLERLCEILNVEPPEEILEGIIRIDKYYIVARYPDYKKNIDVPTKDAAETIYNKTEEIYKWLMENLGLQR